LSQDEGRSDGNGPQSRDTRTYGSRALWIALGILLGGIIALGGAYGRSLQRQAEGGHGAPTSYAGADDEGVGPGSNSVEPPPFRDEDMFPCTECHNGKDLVLNRERRQLEMAHEDIVLHHDEEHRWCLDCHDAENRDKLHLTNGTLIDFTESQRLCGQCHGDKYRDWRLGIHGRRTGLWNGKKEYLLCVHCHWAHAPKFEPLEPKPRPRRPSEIR
jgi:hypothetical protein